MLAFCRQESPYKIYKNAIDYLDNNNLTGAIPLEIENLTNLTELFLYYNQLTGEIPESICQLNIDFSIY